MFKTPKGIRKRSAAWKKRNRSAMTVYHKKWLKANPEKRREYENRYIAKNRNKVNARRRKWRRETGYDKIRNRLIRERVIKKYGGKCRCCGTKIFQFLSFDHIKGRGKKHRDKLIATGQKLILWLDKRKKLKSIQLLCHKL
jgi:hypothetical protein